MLLELDNKQVCDCLIVIVSNRAIWCWNEDYLMRLSSIIIDNKLIDR